jgi:hypothetical protein
VRDFPLYIEVLDVTTITSWIIKWDSHKVILSVAFDSTGLDNLYKQMTSERSKFDVMYSPNIKHAKGFDKYSNVFAQSFLFSIEVLISGSQRVLKSCRSASNY